MWALRRPVMRVWPLQLAAGRGVAGASRHQSRARAPSLYKRMGGEAKLRPLVSDIYDAHVSDPLTGLYFGASSFAKNTGRADRVKDRVFEFFSSGIGGPHTYEGEDMVSAHKHMKIDGQAFHAVVYHVLSNMHKHKTGGRAECEEVFDILMSLKGDVLSGSESQDAERPNGYPASGTGDASLYERMGGEAKLRPLVSDIYDGHRTDPLTAPYFGAAAFSQNTGNADLVKERVFQFFSSGIGGPHTYEGRDMEAAHRSMRIDGQAFHGVVYHVLSNMAKHSAGGRAEREEVLSILMSLRDAVFSGTTSGEGGLPASLVE